MAFQPTDHLGSASLPGNMEMTAPEQNVLRHLTAAWAAFLQLPTERVEYVIAFQGGFQELQRQIAARPGNRAAGLIVLPVGPTDTSHDLATFAVPADTRTVVQKALDQRAKRNARHKRRREALKARDPEALRERERRHRLQHQERQNAILAAAGHVKRKAAPPAPPQTDASPIRTDSLEPPPGLTRSAMTRWRYNNDPIFREHVKSRNNAYNQKRRAEGHKKKRAPRTEEERVRERERNRIRLATDPVYAEKRRAHHREYLRRYRQTLKRLANSGVSGAEVRIRQLRADPVYSAAHAAVPAAMTPHHRADIVSDIIMAVLEGQITLEEVPKKAKSFITAHHRRSETYSTVSLDAPIGDGKVTMHDFATEGLWSQETTFNDI